MGYSFVQSVMKRCGGEWGRARCKYGKVLSSNICMRARLQQHPHGPLASCLADVCLGALFVTQVAWALLPHGAVSFQRTGPSQCTQPIFSPLKLIYYAHYRGNVHVLTCSLLTPSLGVLASDTMHSASGDWTRTSPASACCSRAPSGLPATPFPFVPLSATLLRCRQALARQAVKLTENVAATGACRRPSRHPATVHDMTAALCRYYQTKQCASAAWPRVPVPTETMHLDHASLTERKGAEGSVA